MAVNLRALATKLGARDIKRLSKVQPLIHEHSKLEQVEKRLARLLAKTTKRRERLGERIEHLLDSSPGRRKVKRAKKRKLSAAGRRAIIAAINRRWAKVRAAKKAAGKKPAAKARAAQLAEVAS